MQNFTHPIQRNTLVIVFLVLFSGMVAAQQPLLLFNSVGATGLSSPLDMKHAGDGTNRLFVVERGGNVKVFSSTFTSLGTFLTLSGNFTTGGERGLLSIAFHPDYETNRYFFIYYTNGSGGVNIDRFQTQAGNPNAADAASRTNILTVAKPVVYSNHNGGNLHFGPDGYLYFGLGDSGDAGDPGNLAQNGNSLWGKMLRINVDNFTTPPYYTVPVDNPYVGDPAVLDEIWSLGLRNPWRWCFDRGTGDMWIADVGQGNQEEVNYVAAGTTGARNYGWRCYEGTAAYNTSGCLPQSSYVTPIFTYPHNNTTGGFSITGGVVYRGAEFPFLQGYYMCVDYVSANAWLIKNNGGGSFTSGIQTGLPGGVAAFAESESGDVYAVSLSGTIYKVNATNPIPVTLSKFSGLYYNSQSRLFWQTDFEQLASRFDVEYSNDGANWQLAGTVAATSVSTGSTYSFTHNAILNKETFYRLKIVDNNGRFSYSGIVTLTPKHNEGVVIYPTVIQNNVIQMNLARPFNKLQLLTNGGQVVYSASLLNQTGTVRLPLPGGLAKGMYLVALTNNEAKVVQKVVIQ